MDGLHVDKSNLISSKRSDDETNSDVIKKMWRKRDDIIDSLKQEYDKKVDAIQNTSDKSPIQRKADREEAFNQFDEARNKVRERWLEEEEIVFEKFQEGYQYKSGGKNTGVVKTLKGLMVFPGRNSRFTAMYFQKKTTKSLETLKTAFINYTPSGTQHAGAVYSELLAAYLGPLRLGVGTMLSVATKESIDTTIINQLGSSEAVASYLDSINSLNLRNSSLQRLFSSGGNLSVNIAMPLIDYTSRNNDFSFNMVANSKFCFDIPALGALSNQFSFVNEWNMEANAIVSFSSTNSNDKNLSVLISTKGSLVTGSNDFFKNLDADLNRKKAIGYFEGTLGFRVTSFLIKGTLVWTNDRAILTDTKKPRITLSTNILINDLINK